MTELNHTPESAPPPSGHLVKAHYYVGGLGLCLSILLVILRLSHRHSSRRLGWDDVFLFLSLAFSAAIKNH
ncbi:hypothetical protein LX36DRAFT_662413 [Colletotrichum falcatum]|nr:hypothetical protein LX36DRAFT_662413 [Colletotrichum falcatum]